MTSPNNERIDEELLQQLGLGKPALEGEAWDLEDMIQTDTHGSDDFLETLDALQILQDLGRMELEQNPPELDPPKDTDTRNVAEELLALLDDYQLDTTQYTSHAQEGSPELEPPKPKTP